MTDNPTYAETYIKSGGQVVQTRIPNETLDLLRFNNLLYEGQGNHILAPGLYGKEYRFDPLVKPFIVKHFTPFEP